MVRGCGLWAARVRHDPLTLFPTCGVHAPPALAHAAYQPASKQASKQATEPLLLPPHTTCVNTHCQGAGFLLWELSTPFVHLRWLLHKSGRDGGRLYLINGLVMMAVFFLCRPLWGTWLSYKVRAWLVCV
jgi:hypothetical protein